MDAALPLQSLPLRHANEARVANVLVVYLHCLQGVPGAPYRVECPVFVREPGADDQWPDVRLRSQLPTRYPIISAA
jgi:hypothetical protein